MLEAKGPDLQVPRSKVLRISSMGQCYTSEVSDFFISRASL